MKRNFIAIFVALFIIGLIAVGTAMQNSIEPSQTLITCILDKKPDLL